MGRCQPPAALTIRAPSVAPPSPSRLSTWGRGFRISRQPGALPPGVCHYRASRCTQLFCQTTVPVTYTRPHSLSLHPSPPPSDPVRPRCTARAPRSPLWRYSPNNIKAVAGDHVEFHFFGEHTAVSGDFSKPCSPATTGFYSGEMQSKVSPLLPPPSLPGLLNMVYLGVRC